MANSVLMSTDGDESSCSSSCFSVGTTKIKGQRMEYSHKLTEKRRRDRMNISMSEIAQLLPASTPTKQLEKAEILEKTIIYIKKLQDLTGNLESGGKTESSKQTDASRVKRKSDSLGGQQVELTPKYFTGFSDCIKEVFHCLTNVEAMDLQEPCFQRLMGHLGNQLQFLVSTEEGQTGKQTKHDKDGASGCDCENATSNERVESLLSSTKDDSCSRKRTADADQGSADTFGENSGKRIKRVNLDLDESCNRNDSCSIDSSSNSPKEENGSDSLCTNGCMESSSSVSDGGGSSCGSEKRKDGVLPELPHPSKLENKASYDDGSVSMGGNIPLSRLGLDFPLHATPLSPRTPYIPNPFCLPTYALHPAGTHFIPVLLHSGVLVRPFSDVSGCASAAVPNYPRLGGLQYPFFASNFSLFSHVNAFKDVNAFKGTNGLHYTKDDSSKKQSDATDSSVVKTEDPSLNGTNSKALLNQEIDSKKKPNIQNSTLQTATNNVER